MAALLPDPPAQDVWCTVISVDDHLVEPPDLFEGRVPAAMADRAPKVIETRRGHQVWLFDDQVHSQVGLNAVAGRDPSSWDLEPCRFEDMRRGCFDPDARVHDQDLAGIWASMSFPSQISGFCGTVFSRCSDPALGLAVTRAWNDWVHDVWWQAHPERTIPLGITWLADPELGAEEVRRNAARGFRAVTLPEQPHRVGYPSVHSGYWDPVLAACEETGTVVCLHVGSSGMMDMALDGPLVELGATLFGALSLHSCADWLWSGRPVQHPELKIAMSEGGIGWVPLLVDRLDYVMHHSGHGRAGWMDPDRLPSEVLRESFWFCTIDDPSSLGALDVIGEDHVMVEVDYPHADSLWPAVQDHLRDRLGHLPAATVRKLTHENAAALFRHPLPQPALPVG